MTETSKNQKVNSYKIAQVMFETFNILGLYINFIRKLSLLILYIIFIYGINFYSSEIICQYKI